MLQSNIVIRRMETKDVEEVALLEQSIFSRPWSKDDFLDSLQPDKENIYVVVERENQIVAYCGMWCILGEGQINNVAVSEEYRGNGYGYQLLQYLIELGNKQGITAYTLEVRESNCSAIKLYEKIGFQNVGIRKKFYDKPTENAVIMWLYR